MESFYRAQDWLNHLYSEARFFAQKKTPSLDTTHKYLDLLGRPDRSFAYRVVVGGTAGKGTVCRRVEQHLLDLGETVVTLSSPHIQVVTERIRINGKLIDPELFAETVFEIKNLYEEHQVPLTYYEAMVLVGIRAGQKSGCEILVAEIGMGGEWDAVNAVEGPRVAALTFVGDDHLDILGPTLEDVARTKAGIFTKDTVLGLSYDKNYCSIIQAKSSIDIEFIKGISQKLNKKLAQKICRYIAKENGVMRPIKMPARWEKVKEEETTIILDGAHSKPRFEFLEKKLKKLPKPCIGVLAMTNNHESDSFESIIDYFDEIIWTSSTQQRVFQDPEVLQKKFGRGECITDPQEALDKALSLNPSSVLVTGSFYLCGEVRERFYKSEEIIKQQSEWPE